MRMMMRRHQRGQHLSEYAVLIGTAAAAALSMQLLVRNSVSTVLGSTAGRMVGPPGRDPNSSQTVSRREAVDASGLSFNRQTAIEGSEKGTRTTGFILAEPAGPYTDPNPSNFLSSHAAFFVEMVDPDLDGDFMVRDENGVNQLTDEEGNLLGEDGIPDILALDAEAQHLIEIFTPGARRPWWAGISGRARFAADRYAERAELLTLGEVEALGEDTSTTGGSWNLHDEVVFLDINRDGNPDFLDTNGDFRPDVALVGAWVPEDPGSGWLYVGSSDGDVGIKVGQGGGILGDPYLLPFVTPGKDRYVSSDQRFTLRRPEGSAVDVDLNGDGAVDGVNLDVSAEADLGYAAWKPIAQDGDEAESTVPVETPTPQTPETPTLGETADAEPSFAKATWIVNWEQQQYAVEVYEDGGSEAFVPAATMDVDGDGTPDYAAVYLVDLAERGLLGDAGTPGAGGAQQLEDFLGQFGITPGQATPSGTPGTPVPQRTPPPPQRTPTPTPSLGGALQGLNELLGGPAADAPQPTQFLNPVTNQITIIQPDGTTQTLYPVPAYRVGPPRETQ